ncbi:phosphoribosylformylglycinamidine synthase subunit PurS [Bacillaceae bacterium S4-13-58]
MYKVKVFVTLKNGVLDPQGKAVKHSLETLGYEGVQEVRVGKYLELTVEKLDHMEEQIKEMCEKLLANPVMEDYEYTIEEVVPQ